MMDTRELKILATDFMCHSLSRSISDCEKIGEVLFDAAQEIDRLQAKAGSLAEAQALAEAIGGEFRCAPNPNGEEICYVFTLATNAEIKAAIAAADLKIKKFQGHHGHGCTVVLEGLETVIVGFTPFWMEAAA